MASTAPLLSAIKSRHSIYSLANDSPISDARIEELVTFAVTHCPSAFNVQSARAVVLFGEQHRRFWGMAGGHMRRVLGEERWKGFEAKVKGLEGGYGTVLWFEDEDALDVLSRKNAMIAPLLGEWSAHSSGIHQYVVWTALETEGLGCNLQHYNFLPEVIDDTRKIWDLPGSWRLHAQLVFGRPTGAPNQRTYLPVEESVRVIS